MSQLAQIGYLVAAALFVLGLKGLGHPRTAVRGNLLGSLGMLIAVVVTLLDRSIVDFTAIIAGAAVGALIGAVFAIRVQMTAMPQMVALFNGFGGAASVLVAGGSYIEGAVRGTNNLERAIAAGATALIGAVTFTGSLIAFAKLQELMSGKSITFPGMRAITALLVLAGIGLVVLMAIDPSAELELWALAALASLLGVLLVIPVGGADMPVVIALLNSYSGLAAAATGFVLDNSLLIIAGSLVGASGLILTRIMCKAMNRSLANVMLGKGSVASVAADADEV
ncbi:MAG TPA: NAD(P)(+) transhydrogenase (Re/Si-specific) subunit beta, partial [Thermoanaerobaculia bacterium]|nr:NAD(P)(+) transhydrogenase (Re/Si-specific) subunit beta [Thermoanaerobaculia bacterium]